MMTTSPWLKSRTDSMINGLGSTAHQVGDSVNAQTAALERRVSDAWAQMRELEERAAQRARWAAASADDYAHEHPWQLILAAAALGFAAGAMLGSRRRNHRMQVS